MTPMIAIGERGSPITQSASRMGILATAIKCPKTVAPATIIITIHVIRKASLTALRNPCQVSLRVTIPMSNAPAAPAPPACVGLNHPRKSPIITMANKDRVSIIPTSPFILSFQLLPVPAGASSGFCLQRSMITTMKSVARVKPGRIPARNSLPMDCSVIIP